MLINAHTHMHKYIDTHRRTPMPKHMPPLNTLTKMHGTFLNMHRRKKRRRCFGGPSSAWRGSAWLWSLLSRYRHRRNELLKLVKLHYIVNAGFSNTSGHQCNGLQ